MIKHVQIQEAHAQRAHGEAGTETEDRFRAIVELAPDATVVADHDGRITLVNRQTEVLFGYERADLLGQPVELLMPARFHAAHQQHRAQYAMAPRTRPMGANLQLYGRRRDGGEFPVEVSLSLLHDDIGGHSVISVIRDISERQRTEAARAAAEAASEELRQLQAISDVALTHQSLDELLGALLSGIRTVMAVDNVAILLTSEDGQALTLYTAQGPEEGAVASQLSVPIGRGVAGRIAATHRPLIVDDLSNVEVINPFLREHFRALVGVPLLVGDRLIGVVHVASASPRQFTDADAHLLQLAAERIAHALDHARMYDAEQAARVEAEAALARAQASESRCQRLMESNIIGIVVGDTERAIEANDAYLRLLGYTREDLVAGRLRWMAVTPPEYHAANERAVQQALTTGASEPLYKEYVRQDGSRVPVLVGLTLLERDPARFFSFVLDLSEQKRLEHERQAAHASELVQLEVNRHMEQFLATAAHDLRSPVTGALFGVELAQRRVKRLAQSLTPPQGNRPTEQDQDDTACDNGLDEALAALDVLEHANQAVEYLSRLISRLFDLSQAKTGKLEIRPMACDLADVVRGSVGTQRALTPGRTIHLDLPTGVEVPVIADADRLGQVVTNFLTNALKYSVPDRPVNVALEVNERRARVAVRDEGPGLPQEEQERVWEPFHRVPGIEVQGGACESLGLGLFICKTIVERHGGTVGVESVEGKGATFWFTLPLASAIA